MITKILKILLAGIIAPILLAVLAFSGIVTLVFSPLSLLTRIRMPSKPEPSVALTDNIKFIDSKRVEYAPASH